MTDRLYHLLPRVVRVRDAETGEPLRQLLSVFDEQLELIETDIACMYDDLFIETCSDEVVARLGSVVGSHDGATRAEVANILRHRGTQGLASTLTRLARESTGHAVDITEVAPGQLDVAILAEDSQPVFDVEACQLGPGCYTFNPIGADTALTNDPSGSDGAFTPRRLKLTDDPRVVADSISIVADKRRVSPAELVFVDLGTWGRPSGPDVVFVDPERGRFAFGIGRDPEAVRVSYAHGVRRATDDAAALLERLLLRHLPIGATARIRQRSHS